MPRLNLIVRYVFLLGLVISVWAGETPGAWVVEKSQPGDFALVEEGLVADLVVARGDFKVVEIATSDFADDVERVTGRRPTVRAELRDLAGPVVLIGTLGKNPLIDGLVATGKLDVSALRGQWETFLIATVMAPSPGVTQALVIVGSDRRGTAYGVYELSQAIGVSPWYWWADVAPEKKSSLYVAAGTRKFGPPSVQYRGIFINDEDWGLQPWAAKTFTPEEGGIGPKVYRKVFELLLRLKANTLWPAMHKCTKPFNDFPENAQLADDYAIVMGSSHAEPMLRNNVREWSDAPERYNYLINRDGVRRYWEDRVAANGCFENIYTLGMRGIHDSNMQGPKTDAERIVTLEKIFADQRAMLAKHVRPDVEQVPQMFCVYKEVLDLYRKGLKVPDDVTIVWPDDNFGYVRNFASAEEQKRSGGFGVYYHISYLGRPLAYLWLCTTPPALIWEEMSKAYDYGARKLWIVNVGDIKPAEIGTEFFLQMAWDIKRWRSDNLPRFLEEWAAREFGAVQAKEIADIMATYYQLNYQRKPDHLQWWLPKETPCASPFNDTERKDRLAKFTELSARVQKIPMAASALKQNAFEQLVTYPVYGTAFANTRYIQGETGNVQAAEAADEKLQTLTRHFGETMAGGKWRRFMQLEPADDDWKSMRIARWQMQPFAVETNQLKSIDVISREAEHFNTKVDRSGAGWVMIPGLGRTGEGSVAVYPTTMPAVPIERAVTDAPRLDYSIRFLPAGEFTLRVYLIPTHPLFGGALRFAVALDEAPPQLVELVVNDGGNDWAQGVLNNTRMVTAMLNVAAPGPHTLRIFGVEAGVVLDKLVIVNGNLKPSYLGSPETREK